MQGPPRRRPHVHRAAHLPRQRPLVVTSNFEDDELEKQLGHPVKFVFTDWQSAPTVDVKPGECVLMENTRYHAAEEKNDPIFSAALANAAAGAAGSKMMDT